MSGAEQIKDNKIQIKDFPIDPRTATPMKLLNYEGYAILVQSVGVLFQIIIAKDGLFWQHYYYDESMEGKKSYTPLEIVRITEFVTDGAIALAKVLNGEEVPEVTGEQKEILEMLGVEADVKVKNG